MPNLEPTYLRYVYDSLNKGALNAENAAALPHGFIGLYEQEFTEKTPAGERKKVLHQLALWALFKGPVSANMAAAVLELEEEQMKDLVDTYSSWFNSPESGKYQLYHERLRVYLLQKLKADEVQVLNEKLISFLEDAIKQAKREEDEYYALEYLHQHMALESQLGNHYERLHGYVNQESLWKRQIQLSKGYEWSQNAVQQGIKEGARRNHEMNTIRSTVNSVKLMTQEQNSAEDILNLLNEGDFQTALKRAESWEGERQFKLYLLFIHELTIGTSSEADFRKEACKAVLEAIEQTPEDHSVLDWCKFYPELAIYKYHEELLKMELDGMVIWKRAEYDILQIVSEGKFQINIILNLVKSDSEIPKRFLNRTRFRWESPNSIRGLNLPIHYISRLYNKKNTILKIFENLIKNNRHNDAIKIIKTKQEKELSPHIKFLLGTNFKLESKKELNESLKLISETVDDYERCKAYTIIGKLLVKQANFKESINVLKKSIQVATEITNEYQKSIAFQEISRILMEQGEVGGAMQIASYISYNWEKSQAFQDISRILMKQGEIKKAKKAMTKASCIKKYPFVTASEITNDITKSSDYSTKMVLFFESYKKHLDLCNKYEANIFLEKIISILLNFNNYSSRPSTIEIENRSVNHVRNKILNFLFAKEGKKVLFRIIKQSLNFTNSKNANDKSKEYLDISKVLMEQGKMKESLKVASEITDDRDKSNAFQEISRILMEQGKMKESLKLASEITNEYQKSIAFQEISRILMEQGKKEESLKLASEITDDYDKSRAYSELSKTLMEQGKKEESLSVASEITEAYSKSKAYRELSKILLKLGEMKESQETMKESLKVASEITDDYDKSRAYSEISKVLMEQGKKEESLKLASEITDDYDKSRAYSELSKTLMEQGKKEESLSVASEITEAYSKSKAFLELSKILLENGEKNDALKLALKAKKLQILEIKRVPITNFLMKIYVIDNSHEDIIELLSSLRNIKLSTNRYRAIHYKYLIENIDIKNFLKLLGYCKSEHLQNGLISEVFKKFDLMNAKNFFKDFSINDFNFLYLFSNYPINFYKYLSYQAKMACFFEEERNEEKLDMLSEVLDIKDWRRISAST